jgi:hypothetical protein
MRALAVILCAVSLTSTGFAQSSSSPRSTPANPPGRSFPLPFSSDLPYDVDLPTVQLLDRQGHLLEAQREFDILAWQAFIALNWPADRSGKPIRGKTIADAAGDRVWSFWRPASSVFLPDGAPPKPWAANAAAMAGPPLFRSKAAWRQHATAADENFQAFSGPLVDQNGKWVRYQVLMNHEEFDYIVQNRLYSLDGQVAFSRRPDGNQIAFPVDDRRHGRHGAIEVKFAWKELGANDDPSRFFTSHIQVVTAEPFPPGQKEPQTREIVAGLVGMHIAMRTRSSPEWIWATFEQIDNVRANPLPDGKQSHPNFSNPQLRIPPNVLPARNAIIDPHTGSPEKADPPQATTWIESLTTTPVQVERIAVPTQGTLNQFDQQIAASTAELNRQVQRALLQQHSVFGYYELIGTQWPVHPNAPAFAGGEGSAPESITHKTPGDMVPVFLVNTTMETYFQKGEQPAGALEQDDRLANNAPPIDSTKVIGTESCVGCHYSAGAAIGFKLNADGSFAQDASGKKIPIFGENGHFGKTGNAAFSWLLQIEAQAEPINGVVRTTQPRRPAGFLDINRLDAQYGQ